MPGTGTHSRGDGRPGRGREGRGGGGSARCTSARPLAHCPVSGSRRLVTTGPSLDPVVALESGGSPGTGQSGWVMSTAPGRGVWSTERAQTLSSLVRYETGRTRDTRGVENKRPFISGVLLRAPPPGTPPRRPHRCLRPEPRATRLLAKCCRKLPGRLTALLPPLSCPVPRSLLSGSALVPTDTDYRCQTPQGLSPWPARLPRHLRQGRWHRLSCWKAGRGPAKDQGPDRRPHLCPVRSPAWLQVRADGTRGCTRNSPAGK